MFEGLKLAAAELAASVVKRSRLKEESLASLIVRRLELLSSVCRGSSATISFFKPFFGPGITGPSDGHPCTLKPQKSAVWDLHPIFA